MSAAPGPITPPPGARFSRGDTAGWVLITGGAQAVKLIVTLVSAAVLSRLLRPEDFGLIATATPIFAFTAMLQNLGLAEALVQRPNLERGHVNALFCLTVGMSIALGLVLLLAAPLIAGAFGQPRLTEIVQAMAGVAIISAAAGIPLGMMNRKMKFRQFAAIEIVGSIAGITAGVIFALITGNYWALVLMQAVIALVQLAGGFAFAGWAPGAPKFDREFRVMLGMGAGFSTFNLLNFLSRNADMLLISFAHGPVALGFYERAYKLTMFPLWQAVTPISRVLVPVLARLPDDPVTYRERYFEATAFMMAAVQPGLIAAIVFATPTVELILGPGWREAAPVFFWLGLTGLTQIYAYPISWLLVSQGRGKECALMGAVIAGIAVASFVIGLPYGPVGVAMAYAIGDVVLRTPIAWWFAGRRGPVSFMALASSFVPHASAMAAAAAALAIISRVWEIEAFPELVAAALLSYAVYGIALMGFPDKRKLAQAFTRGLQRRLKGRAARGAT